MTYNNIIQECDMEDMIKLTCDYDALLEKYMPEASGNKNSLGEGSNIPVLCDCCLSGRKVRIIDSPQKMYTLPEFVRENENVLFMAHSRSSVYNNLNVRVDDWGIDEFGNFVMKTSRTTYFDSLITNRALDFRLPDGTTLRGRFYDRPYELRDSVLSNHLGFNGWIESADGYLPLVKRSPMLSIGKNTYGDSIGAGLKTKYALKNGVLTNEGIDNAIISEIEDELKIDRQYLDKQPVLLSAYRDLVEGGKPQLMFYIKSTLTREEIEGNFRNMISERDQKHLIIDGSEFLWIHKDSLYDMEVSADGVAYKEKKYRMMPSAAVGIVMLRKYFAAESGTDVQIRKETEVL